MATVPGPTLVAGLSDRSSTMYYGEQHSNFSSSSNNNNNNDNTEETEQLLHDAFEELEKERAMRMGLEAQVKALQEKQKNSKAAKKKRRSSSKITTSDSAAAASLTVAAAATFANNDNEEIPTAASRSSPSSSMKHCKALQQEIEGYRQIVDALTSERPAIRAALEAENERRRTIRTGHGTSNIKEQPVTLPLHVIRLLEVMPWDPKAQEYASCTEEIYEWQIYNAKQQAWLATMRQFPSFFQALPTLEKTDNTVHETICHQQGSGAKKDRSWLMFLAGCEAMALHSSSSSSNSTAPPIDDNAVLTNHGLTYLIDFKDGFPLAKDGGTWKWAGGWHIEKRVAMEIRENDDDRDDNNFAAPNSRTVLECDSNGWSYATEASDFLNPNALELCQDSPGEIKERVTGEKVSFLTGGKIVERHPMPLRRIRRRKWTRRRVLIDYPFASEQTQAFLQLLAENASLKVAANNISDHLVETKMKVTQAELQSQQTEEETNNKVKQLQQEIQLHEGIIAKLKEEKKNTVVHDEYRCHYTNAVEKDIAAENVDSSRSGDSSTGHQENVSSIDKDKHSSSSTNGNKDLHHLIKKDIVQQGKDFQSLQNILSHWVVSSTSKLKIVSNHPSGRDDSVTETPVPEDSSSAASSTEVIEEDDEGEEELTVKHLEDAASTSHRNEEGPADDSNMDINHDSNSSQKSFDWKKLGRETIEKIKEGPAKAASSAKLPWLSPSSTGKEDKQDDTHHQEEEHDMLSENEEVTPTEITADAS